jgi:hypothetical protein
MRIIYHDDAGNIRYANNYHPGDKLPGKTPAKATAEAAPKEPNKEEA